MVLILYLNGAVSKFATNLIGAETLKELTGEDKLKIGLGVGAQSSKFLMAAITPQKPKVPNIHFIEGEMVLSGTITNSTDLGIGDINIATPGSPNTLDANLPWYNYPFYNEPLGLIAFLEKPNLDYYSEYSKEPVHTSNCYQGYCWPVDIPGISTYYIRISNPIKFALNPAAEINVSKTRIYAGYIAEIKWIDNYGTGKETSRDKFHSGFYPISNLDDILIPIDVEARWGTINSLTDLKIKFIIEYEFDRNKYGKINKSINILTYNVNYKQVEKSSLSSFINARNFPEPYKVINDVTYAQNTTITALDKIIIKGNVKTTSDDVKVTFVAGNEVVVNNPSVLKPNITIKTGNINGFTFDYSINPQSIQDVKTFCQSTQYKANTTTSSSLKSARLVVDENKTNDLKVNINDSKFDNTTFTIYPNPTKDKLNIQILNQEEKNIKIKLLSTVGYSVFSQELNHISNENLIQIDLSNCSKGIYLLLIQSGTKQINKKIIVQ